MIDKHLTTRYIIGFMAVFLVLLGCAEHYSMSKTKNTNNQQKNGPVTLPENTQKATFAAGCFWHVEYAFSQIPGVLKTTVGYIGGETKNPTYKEVCTDKTGHAEAVEVLFDPNQVTYEQLLDAFWQMHDPTQLNRQGPDSGTQYRSAIFFHTPQQEKAAKESKEKFETSGKFDKPIVTQIVPAEKFYPAEEYHQKYFEKHGKTCKI